jgi:hypothetical protein
MTQLNEILVIERRRDLIRAADQASLSRLLSWRSARNGVRPSSACRTP